jgi:hypothetical protein
MTLGAIQEFIRGLRLNTFISMHTMDGKHIAVLFTSRVNEVTIGVTIYQQEPHGEIISNNEKIEIYHINSVGYSWIRPGDTIFVEGAFEEYPLDVSEVFSSLKRNELKVMTKDREGQERIFDYRMLMGTAKFI